MVKFHRDRLSELERDMRRQTVSRGTASGRVITRARSLLEADGGEDGDGAQEARLTALACSQPPDGQARWSLRLLAREFSSRDEGVTVSYELVRCTLEKLRPSAPRAAVEHSTG